MGRNKKTPERKLKKKTAFNFFTWLRSGLRNMSRRYPPIYEALASAKRPYKGSNARQKFCYECASCKGLFSAKEVAVDHRVDCGTLKTWADVQAFMERLFCGKEGLDVLCDGCHSLKTLSAKLGISIEEAALEQQSIAFCKKSIKEQLAYFQRLGYNSTSTSNAEKRRKLIRTILEKESK